MHLTDIEKLTGDFDNHKKKVELSNDLVLVTVRRIVRS